MKQKKKYLSLLIFFLEMLNLSSNAQIEIGPDSTVLNRIQSVEHSLHPWVKIKGIPLWTLEKRLEHYHAKGLSIAVIKDFKIDWAKGYGWADSSELRPVNTATLFQAGSISKSLNALGILKLAQEGKLDLYTDINRYLQSWKFPYDSLSKGKKIYIANLLSHTAGLTIHGFPGYPIDDTIPSIFHILNGSPPSNTKPVRSEFEPGEEFKYSGGGTTISQLIIEDITREPYAEFMQKAILDPLEMKTSSYEQPPFSLKKNLLATGYRSNGDEVKGKYHIYPEQAAAGLWTNPSELTKFIIEIQLSLLGKSNKIFSVEMTRKYITPYVDSGAALGVFVQTFGGTRYFSHAGSDRGFKAQFFASIENGYGAIVMANTDNVLLIDEVINAIASTYNWNGFIVPEVTVIKVSDSTLISYAGKYSFEGQTATCIKEGSELFLLLRNQKMQIHFTSQTDFFVFGQRAKMQFSSDEKGKINGFIFSEDGYETFANKVE